MIELPNFILLGENTNRKGESFEFFLRQFLRTQGYSNIENLRRTGMEIDLKGLHTFSGTSIIAEAKGYNENKNVASKDVDAFKTKFDRYVERYNLTECKPFFITTTDFAWEAWDSNERDGLMKFITFINGEKLIELLHKVGYIPSLDFIDSKIKNKIPFILSKKYILVFDGKLYWLQTFNDESNKDEYIAIFDKNGDFIKHYDSVQILDLLPSVIKDLIYIDLDIKFRILEHLIMKGESSLEDISENLEVSEESIELNLTLLNKYDKIVKSSNLNKYKLSNEIEDFRYLFNMIFNLHEKNILIKFYISNYFEEMLDSRTMNYILNRFFINELPNDLLEQFKRLINLFPSVLHFCLNSDTDFYLEISKSKIKDQNVFLYGFLTQQLFENSLLDYFKNKEFIRATFKEKNITEESLIGNLIILKNHNQFLDFKSEHRVIWRKFVGKGTIKAGTPVKPTENKQFVNFIATLILLKDYEGAIKKCDEFLDINKLQEFYPEFLINKGVAEAYLGKFTEAIENYKKALEYKIHLPLIFINLIRAWFSKYLQAVNLQKEYELDIIRILRYLKNAKKNIDKFKTLNLSDEKVNFLNEVEDFEQKIAKELNNHFNQSLNLTENAQIINFLYQVVGMNDDFLKPIYEIHSEKIDSLLEKNYYEFNPYYWNSLANIYKLLNKNDKALELIEKAFVNLDEKPGYFMFIDTKAEILYNLSQFEESYEIFSKILKKDKDDYQVKDFYAETCWKAAKVAEKLNDVKKSDELKNLSIELLDTHCQNDAIKKKIKKEINLND